MPTKVAGGWSCSTPTGCGSVYSTEEDARACEHQDLEEHVRRVGLKELRRQQRLIDQWNASVEGGRAKK